MNRWRYACGGALAAMTVAVVVHGDPLWLLFMFASDVVSLGFGLILGRARRIEDDIALAKIIEEDTTRRFLRGIYDGFTDSLGDR